jgi:hypothetical protein
MRRWLLGAAVAALVATPDAAALGPSLVFASDRAGTWQAYALHDGALAQLTFGAAASTRPAPSPDGRWILFARAGGLWRMRPDGSAQRRVIPVGSDASWLSDSQRFVYVDGGGGIRIGRVDGRRVVGRTAPPVASQPRWSHGALLLLREGELVVRARGRERTIGHDVAAASWSPDGRRIAVLDGDGIGLVRPDGGARVDIARRSPGPASAAPAWSADGERLAYADGAGIYVADPVSRRTALISATPAVELAWNGSRIAFAPYGEPGIRAVGASGGEVATIFDGGPLDRDARDLAWTAAAPRGLRLSFRTPQAVAGPVEVTPRELRTIGPIGRLDANGDRVAFTTCTGSPAVGVWGPGETSIGAPATGRYSCRRGPSSASVVFQIAAFGDDVAYLWKEGGIQVRFGLVLVDARGTRRTVATGATCCSGDPQLPPVGFLHASGDALVFSTWERGGTNRPPVTQATWRVRDVGAAGRCPGATDSVPRWVSPVDGPCELLATVSGRYEPLAFDGSRLVVRSGQTFVVDPKGAVQAMVAVPEPIAAAAFAGRDVVVVTRGALRVVDGMTGLVMRTWPLPTVDGGYCGVLYCGASGLALAGATPRIAAYVFDGRVHLLRLSDGADVAFAAATAAQLTPAGLFYAYTAPPPFVGRIAFVPYVELPLG